jgi:hypothetical protein
VRGENILKMSEYLNAKKKPQRSAATFLIAFGNGDPGTESGMTCD